MEGTDDSGMIVWVRQSRDRHWPGVIVLGAHIGKKSATNGFCWVFLFGIHKTLEVHGSRTKPFFCDFKEHYESAKALGVFKKAVMESIQACAMRCNKQGKNTEQNLLKWAEDGFQMGGHSEETPYKRLLGGELPELVKSQFFDRKDLHVRTDQLVNTDNENGHYFMVPSPDHPEPNVPTRISVKSLKEGKYAVTKTGGETRVLLKRLSLNQEDRVSALGGQQVQQQVLRTRSRQESKRNGSHAESNTRRKPPLLLRRLSVNREDHVSTLGGQQLQQRTLRTRSLPESEQEGNHSESSTRRKPQVLLKRLSLNQGDPISAQGGRQVQQQVLRSRSQPESECEDSVVAVKRKKIEDRRITRSQSIESSAHHQTLTSIAHTELPKLSCTPQVVLTDIASGQVSDGTGPENGARQETSNIEGAEMRTSDVKNTEETLVDASDIYGRLIWGKFGSYRPWPGVTINGRSFGREMPPMGTTWVFWFGDHKISKIRDGQLQPFVPNFDRFFEMAKPGKIFVRAVLEAIMECSSRCKRGVPDEEDTLMAWAAEGFPTQINKSSLLCGGRIPPVVFKHVQIIESSDTEDEDELSFQCVISPDKENQFNLIREGKSKIEDMCIACEALNFNVVIQHPVVRGGLCEDCRDSLMETVFAIEADGTKMYCSVCGDGGQLFVCDTPECGQVFCRGCVQLLVGKEALENICQSSSWVCYICRPHTPETHGLIEVKRNRVDNLVRLFSPNQQTPKMGPKKPLRVLSLFDGLATGLVVLERLGLDVEVYYASEVDPDSLTVVKVRHAGKAVHVGDVRDLTRSKIASLGRIDLLIGGSPCNDLSLCNPQRKGLHDGTGTGTLFFEYTRILKILQNQPTHLFWLFENTAAMPLGTKREISQYLKCDPAKWDARNFSAMERARYFWGNIPRLYCPLTKLPPCGRLTLTDMVTEGLGRIGQYQKIRTVTRNSNSLLQEKERKFPIVMDGHGDTIWINELERIFGFVEHYTDVGNFSHQRRRGMIGRAWSVPVVEHLLSPLKEFFSRKLQS